MKPARFAYRAPRTVAEAVDLLTEHGEEARLLAGGQSLGPLLNLRLAVPSVVVDLNGVAGLDGVHENEDRLVVGAMVRQRNAERSPAIAAACPLVTRALPYVAHRTIRNRGTIGGSLAHADPAAELTSVAVALDADLVAAGPRGTRTVAAADFFAGHFTTALAPDEVLVAVRFRKQKPGTGSAWVEYAPRHGDFAIAGVAALLETGADGTVTDARLVYAGVGEVPQRQRVAEDILIGHRPGTAVFSAAAAAASDGCRPPSDLIASADYRRHLVGVLTVRALTGAAERRTGF